MYAVIMVHSFEADTPLVLFESYEKAKAYAHWLWQSYYKEEQSQGSALNESECCYDGDYGKVTWADGEKTEFIVTFASEPDPEFENSDFFKYS